MNQGEPMRAHYLQHVVFEGLGSIEPWLQGKGYQISRTALFESEALPDIHDIDWLIIMGGPMSVHDEAEYPWLIQEKTWIRSFIQTGKPVLGICLGAQLIADVLGATVDANPCKEIGWFPIQAAPKISPTQFAFPENISVFHWHGETFNLPDEAVLLASSAACQHQAFQINKHIIGLQCHLETTPEAAQSMLFHCLDELIEGSYIQTTTQILSASPEQYQTMHIWMDKVLDYLHQYNSR